MRACFKTSDGTIVGRLETDFLEDEIYLAQVGLEPPYQCRGVIGDLLRRMDRVLPAIGVHAASLMAQDIGGYAWAALGFEVDDRQAPRATLLSTLLQQREAVVVQLEATAPDGPALAVGSSSLVSLGQTLEGRLAVE